MAKESQGTFAFEGGMNSGVDPEFVIDNQYVQSMNTVNRGGIIRTRPGFQTVFGMPCGQPQGIEFFKTADGREFIVVAVDGKVYRSESPFDTYQQFEGITFDRRAKFVVFKQCLQTIELDSAGVPTPLNRPKNVLMMQDGFSRPAFFDGSEARHLFPKRDKKNPGAELANETPVGLWMSWAGNRLAVGRDHQVFLSDFGNPLKFVESLYLANGTSFYMPEPVTGMVQPSSNAPLIVFGETSNTRLRVDISDRSQWLNTEDFQVTDYNVGCIAGKSIIQTLGLVWWYSLSGLTNLNNALQLNNDSRFSYLDTQMSVTKSNISPEQNGICMGKYENYILSSTPSGDRFNRHTWCLDLLTTPDGGRGWSSYWTGIRPVDWAYGKVRGQERIFCLSRDYDGVNAVYEVFSPDRSDNGHPITCFVETKKHNYGNKDLKRYSHTDMYLDEIRGTVDVSCFYAGNRGGYKQVLAKRIESTKGIFDAKETVDMMTKLEEYRPQSRLVKTREAEQTEDLCNTCGIESRNPNYVDDAFSNLFVWSGDMGVRGYRLWVDANPGDDLFGGDCEEDEEGLKIVTASGCSGTDPDNLGSPFEEYLGAATVTLYCPDEPASEPSIGVGAAISLISEKDADKKANAVAYEDAYAFLECEADV